MTACLKVRSMPHAQLSVDQLFTHAIGLPAGEERSAYLNSACGSNFELKQRVERLLQAHSDAQSFLESPALDHTPTLVPAHRERPGTQIGPYKLLQVIGEGGMGVVYMAEQTEPVKRKVALKLIKPGMDSRQVIARFEAERQALSMMDHVNIARVLDAGTIGLSIDDFRLKECRPDSLQSKIENRKCRPSLFRDGTDPWRDHHQIL